MQRHKWRLQMWNGWRVYVAMAVPWVMALPFGLPMAHPCCYSYIHPDTFRPMFINAAVCCSLL